MKIKLFIAFLITILGFCGFAQEEMSEDERKKVLKQARTYFQMEEFTDAFKLYSILHTDDTNDARVNFELGMTIYEGSFNKLAAKKYLEKAERDGERVDMPELFYYLGRVYHLEHDFLFATAAYSTYMAESLPLGKQGRLRQKEVESYIQQCEELKGLMEESEDILASVENDKKNIHKYYLDDGTFVKIENLGDEVNSAFSEYGPIIMDEGQTMIFTSRREGSTGGLLYTDGEYFEDIYVTKRKFGIFTEVQNVNNMDVFDNVIRNSVKHDATVSISIDEKDLYVYKDNQIEHINYDGENWVQPATFSADFSRAGSQVTSATISSDGSYMILSATRFDCIGGRDLYISENIGTDQWGDLTNIGPELNTIQDEDSPFMLNDTTLYFSSKGHSSIGGYDIFVSYLREEKWSTPENLKIPINSPYDEINYLNGHDGTHAFIASNRQGGFGAFDIYMVTESAEEEIDEEMISNLGKKVQAVLIIDSIVLLESGELDSTYMAELDKKAELMLANDGLTAKIYGAALLGESKDMARKRALKAYNYMIGKGIDQERLAYGKKVQAVLIIDSIVLLESGELDSTYMAELDKKAELMLANDGLTAEIYGAALPGESKDMARKRALKAYNYMIGKGINQKRLTYGKKVQAVLIIDSIVLLESGELDSTYIAELDKKAELMLSNDGLTAEIYGAALPGESKDMARKRALKAYNYMIDKAINEKRLTANYPGKNVIDGKKETVEGGPFVAKYEQTIHFGTNSKLVTEYSRGKLGAFLDFMKDKPNAKVYLSGHSDHIGNEKYNLELSKKRVDSVEEYLRSQGIKQNIRKEYFGESTPRVSMEDVQSDPKKLILNRRVNIVVF